MGSEQIGPLPNRPSANRPPKIWSWANQPPVENFCNLQLFIDLQKAFDWVYKYFFSTSLNRKIRSPFQLKLHALIEMVLNYNRWGVCIIMYKGENYLTILLPCMSTSSRHQCVLQGTMSVDQRSTAIIYISSFPSVYCYTFSLVYQY